jgi:hypothetical protein
MEASIQVSFDTADPHAQADFSAAVLGYKVENNQESRISSTLSLTPGR